MLVKCLQNLSKIGAEMTAGAALPDFHDRLHNVLQLYAEIKQN